MEPLFKPLPLPKKKKNDLMMKTIVPKDGGTFFDDVKATFKCAESPKREYHFNTYDNRKLITKKMKKRPLL